MRFNALGASPKDAPKGAPESLLSRSSRLLQTVRSEQQSAADCANTNVRAARRLARAAREISDRLCLLKCAKEHELFGQNLRHGLTGFLSKQNVIDTVVFSKTIIPRIAGERRRTPANTKASKDSGAAR